MARVYLDTSFISACVTTRSDPKSVYRRDTSLEWLRAFSGGYEVFVSPVVLDELDRAEYPQRRAALEVASRFMTLAISDEVIRISRPIYRDMPLTHYNHNFFDANADNLFHWALIRDEVARDVEIARNSRPGNN